VPTRAGWALLGGVAAALATGRVLALVELYVLAGIGAAAIVLALAHVRRRPPQLTVERMVRPRKVHLGDTCTVQLRVGNAGRRRTPLVTLVDPIDATSGARMVLAPLDADEERAAAYRLPTHRRGVVQIGPLQMVRTDPLGLASRRHRLADTIHLTVLPAVQPLGGRAPGSGRDDPLTGEARPAPGRAGDDDFASLRPYVVGDDLRRVHWPTTARTGQLTVRLDDPPWQGQLTVVVDARADHVDAERFEVVVSLAASLLHAVAEQGDRARLVVTDGTDTGALDARTAHDLLLEHLAVVARHPGLTLPPEPAAGARDDRVVVSGSFTAVDLVRARPGGRATRLVVVADPASPAPTAGAGADVELTVVRPGEPFAAALTRLPRTVVV
jgi:uncharacterized protein (DUF58 family)